MVVGSPRVAGIADGGERGGGRSYCLHGRSIRASSGASKGARRPTGGTRSMLVPLDRAEVLRSEDLTGHGGWRRSELARWLARGHARTGGGG